MTQKSIIIEHPMPVSPLDDEHEEDDEFNFINSAILDQGLLHKYVKESRDHMDSMMNKMQVIKPSTSSHNQ